MKAAAEHLRRYPPPRIVQEELDRLIEAIEAPWGVRIERQIREAMKADDPVVVSSNLTIKVQELGLQPFRPPDPLIPITEEDVFLVCWMGVDTAYVG